MNCPNCGSNDLYFDPIMENYICEECDRVIELEELEEE